MYRPTIYKGTIARSQLVLNMTIAAIYFSWWLIPNHIGNIYLYSLLFFGEIYHVVTAYMFWFTLWPAKKKKVTERELNKYFYPSVNIFIPVAGEPGDVIRRTICAAKKNCLPHHVYFCAK